MPSESLKALERIDLENLTISDIKSIENPVLRDALNNILQRKIDLARSHQNHGSHSDHSTDSARLGELEFAKNLLRTR